MVRRYGKTYLGADREAAIRCREDDIGRFEGIFWWQQYPPVVHPSLEGRFRRASKREVPFEEVALQRRGVVLVRGVLDQFPHICVNTLDGRVFYIHRRHADDDMLQYIVPSAGLCRVLQAVSTFGCIWRGYRFFLAARNAQLSRDKPMSVVLSRDAQQGTNAPSVVLFSVPLLVSVW